MDEPKAKTKDELAAQVVQVLRTIYDPEIPVNIHEIGLIYATEVDAENNVAITMTLTSPMCPVAESLPVEVQEKVERIPGVKSVKVDIVWDPPWSPEMMSEAARLQLGFL